MRPCDCKTTEDTEKLRYNVLRTDKQTVFIINPDYVSLLMSDASVKIGRKEFKELAEFYLKDQGDK